ncbi:MAG: hypothetical protein AAFQ35_03410 [Pseudomonadota bacterium]
MSAPVMETVEFSLVRGSDRDAFIEAAGKINDWIARQPGFVRRRLSHEEDVRWIDQVEWSDLAAAQAAADGIATEPGNAAFMALIDGPSVIMTHSKIVVALR